MLISEVIQKVKNYCQGAWRGIPIKEETTRDKVLYGETDRECTGIVTTIYASIEVIRKAHELGANLIVSHEACFWNHGDHTDWLQDNTAFQKKRELLDRHGICVWHNHDHIHNHKYPIGWDNGICFLHCPQLF